MAKRNQLEVGQQWAQSSRRNHHISKHFFYDMVTILSVEPYEKTYRGQYEKASKGNGVLISRTTRQWGEERTFHEIVQLSELFMIWPEFEIAREAQKIVEKEQEQAQKNRELWEKEVYYPALREFQDAIKSTTGRYISEYDRVGKLPLEVLQAITEALKVSA